MSVDSKADKRRKIIVAAIVFVGLPALAFLLLGFLDMELHWRIVIAGILCVGLAIFAGREKLRFYLSRRRQHKVEKAKSQPDSEDDGDDNSSGPEARTEVIEVVSDHGVTSELSADLSGGAGDVDMSSRESPSGLTDEPLAVVRSDTQTRLLYKLVDLVTEVRDLLKGQSAKGNKIFTRDVRYAPGSIEDIPFWIRKNLTRSNTPEQALAQIYAIARNHPIRLVSPALLALIMIASTVWLWWIVGMGPWLAVPALVALLLAYWVMKILWEVRVFMRNGVRHFKGFLAIKYTTIPYSSIRTHTVERGIFGLMFGWWHVTIKTSATESENNGQLQTERHRYLRGRGDFTDYVDSLIGAFSPSNG